MVAKITQPHAVLTGGSIFVFHYQAFPIFAYLRLTEHARGNTVATVLKSQLQRKNRTLPCVIPLKRSPRPQEAAAGHEVVSLWQPPRNPMPQPGLNKKSHPK